MNEVQVRMDGEDAKVKMAHKVEQGGSVGRAKLGYLNVRKDFSGRLVNTIDIDPVRAPLIEWAKVQEILNQCNRDGDRDIKHFRYLKGVMVCGECVDAGKRSRLLCSQNTGNGGHLRIPHLHGEATVPQDAVKEKLGRASEWLNCGAEKALASPDLLRELGTLYTSASAGVPGFEPRTTDPESAVLPLHHTPMGQTEVGPSMEL